MFSFFGSKKERIPDIAVFTTRVQLYKWLMTEANKSECAIYYFFEATGKELELLLDAAGPSGVQLIDARSVYGALTLPSRGFVAELYPITSPYHKLINTLRERKVTDVTLLSHLESPLFFKLGGERIKTLMNSLGLKEDESISHQLITRAIENLQRKLEEKVKTEKPANSIESWLDLNG